MSKYFQSQFGTPLQNLSFSSSHFLTLLLHFLLLLWENFACCGPYHRCFVFLHKQVAFEKSSFYCAVEHATGCLVFGKVCCRISPAPLGQWACTSHNDCCSSHALHSRLLRTTCLWMFRFVRGSCGSIRVINSKGLCFKPAFDCCLCQIQWGRPATRRSSWQATLWEIYVAYHGKLTCQKYISELRL